MNPTPSPVPDDLPDDLLVRFEERKARYVRRVLTDEEREAYWERMPEGFREQTLRLRDEAQVRVADQTRLVWKHRWKYAIAGGICALVFGSCEGDSGLLFRLFFGLLGAGAAYGIAWRRLDHLTATVLYGGSSVVLSIVAVVSRLLAFNPYLVFFAWLMLFATGAGLSVVAEMEHQRRFCAY